MFADLRTLWSRELKMFYLILPDSWRPKERSLSFSLACNERKFTSGTTQHLIIFFFFFRGVDSFSVRPNDDPLHLHLDHYLDQVERIGPCGISALCVS